MFPIRLAAIQEPGNPLWPMSLLNETPHSRSMVRKCIVVSHNGDLSSPDGQDDAPRIGMAKHVVLIIDHLQIPSKEYLM